MRRTSQLSFTDRGLRVAGAGTASAAGGVFIATAIELGAPPVPTAACLLVTFMAMAVSIHLAMTAIRGTA